MSSPNYSLRMSLYKRIFVVFFASVALTLFGIAYISFSWATIKIEPREHELSKKFIVPLVSVSETKKHLTGVRGEVRAVNETRIMRVIPENATEMKKNVEGTITVVNISSKDQPLRETTRFLSPEQYLFRSTTSVLVPAGGSVEVAVRADEEDVPDGFSSSRFVLPGLWPGLQDKIYGASFRIVSPGNETVRTVSQSDIDKALATLKSDLSKELVNSRSETIAFPHTLVDLNSASSKASHAVGEITNELTISALFKGSVTLFDRREMESYLRTKIGASLDAGQELLPVGADDIEYTIEMADTRELQPQVSALVRGRTIINDSVIVTNKKMLTGKTIAEVEEFIRSYPDIENVTVTLYPFWVMRMPLLTDHITILVKR